MQETILLVRDVGFPIFVALFLLIRIHPTLKKIEITLARFLQFMQNHEK